MNIHVNATRTKIQRESSVREYECVPGSTCVRGRTVPHSLYTTLIYSKMTLRTVEPL